MNHEHNASCEQCESLKDTIQSIALQLESPSVQFYNNEQKEDLKYDFQLAKDMVFQWKCHLLRAENQDKAKQAVMNSLDNDSAFLVMDWAMKFTQIRYREKQSEWYGKRGMNWHVSCIITKKPEDDHLEVKSYSHLFNSCTQDWNAVCATAEHLLATLKAEKPHISKVFLRSDCAGCYDNNSLIAALWDVGKRTDIKVMR